MADTPQPLQQALAGRYRIERELGRGGMATVFLAEDLKHHRRVAIKVLDPEVGGAIGPERFLREIETVANLTHPHILPLHDSGSVGGLLYYVMPYVEGESLRHRIAREGQLPLEDALRVTREIADALEHAHGAGVVHRDIKPENVLLVAGHAVVADFGLARALGSAGPHKLTTVGVTVGTPAYMSPEQAAGASNLDGRSDQYSLACVLYELLAGQPPFTGPSAQSLIHQHLSVAPRPVTDLRPSVPAAVRDALARALAKTPADRYGSMAVFAAALGGAAAPAMIAESAPTAEMAAASTPKEGVAPPPVPRAPRRVRLLVLAAGFVAVALLAVFALQRWGQRPPAGPVRKDWILVAAFEGPPEDSSLAVASRELICAALDQSRTVGSLPRDRILKALVAAGKPPRAPVDAELARELAFRSGVRTVLEGQVGKIGTGYSIVLRLVDADSSRVILTETAAAKSADALIPALGDLAKRLRRGMGENRAALAATRPMTLVATPSFEAYRLYLTALQYARTGSNIQALAILRAALAIDPDFAAAWANMRYPYFNLGYMDSVIWVCDEALRRRDRLTDEGRRRIQAARNMADGDWEGAAAIYDRALLENPDDTWALNEGGADLLWQLGRYEDALERVRRLQKLRPFGPTDADRMNEAMTLSWLGRFDEARRVGDTIKGFWGTPVQAYNELHAGRYAAAESLGFVQLADPRQKVENIGGAELTLADVCRVRGRIATMDSLEARFWELVANPDYGWGDKAQAFRAQMEFSVLCLGRRPSQRAAVWPETTAAGLVTRGLRLAYLGESGEARRCLEQAKRRPRRELVAEGPLPALLEATLAGGEGRWADAARMLQPIAVKRWTIGRTGGDDLSWIRWTLADAYEKVGRPDSAAANLERVVREPMAFQFRSYASLRLVPLYAGLGRAEDARRHWVLLSNAFTRPDPPLMARIERAREAIAALQ